MARVPVIAAAAAITYRMTLGGKPRDQAPAEETRSAGDKDLSSLHKKSMHALHTKCFMSFISRDRGQRKGVGITPPREPWRRRVALREWKGRWFGKFVGGGIGSPSSQDCKLRYCSVFRDRKINANAKLPYSRAS